jgi:hypothetical protein
MFASAAATLDTTTLIAFGLPLVVYLFTLAPTIYNLDSAELTTAAATGGIVRATGYPLYLLLGRFWALLPIGDVGFRMNLLSAVCGALTIALAERILRRLGAGRWARLAALGLLATAPYFWALALIAEVYTLHTALVAAVILSLMRWRERPTLWRLAIPAFLAALSMGNHAATILLAPACVWFVAVGNPKQALRPLTWLVVGAAVLAGLSIYLTLPLRYGAAPAFNYAGWYDAGGRFLPVDLRTPTGLWWLISGRSFSGQMFGYRGAELPGQAAAYFRQLWTAFLAIGIGPGIWGFFLTWRRDWRLGGFLTLIFLANAAFFISYRVVDKDTMYLPTYLIWTLWLGVGYQALLTALGDRGGFRPAPRQAWLARAVMIGVFLAALAWNWHLVDRSDDRSARARGEAILSRVGENALVLGWWDTVPVVEYLQLVEGWRPDVQAVNRFLISGPDMEKLIQTEIGHRPVYINSPPSSLLESYGAVRSGPIYQLVLRDATRR